MSMCVCFDNERYKKFVVVVCMYEEVRGNITFNKLYNLMLR